MIDSIGAGHSRALFLDRDGVINVNYGYVHLKENFEFIDGIFDLVRAARAQNYKIVVVTNQSGIGRGYYSEEQFLKLTTWMCAQFEQFGAPIDKVYFSPYHPTAGIGKYLKDEETRKPRPGMIFQAQNELNVSLERSILIGDKPSDIQAGLAAGVGLNILFSKKKYPDLSELAHVSVTAIQDAIVYLNSARLVLSMQ